jgi:hypothetical protein
MADQLEGLETEPAHEADLVTGHGPLGVDEAGGVRIGLAGVAVAAQVGQHDRVIVGQSRGDVAPGEVILRVAVQHQHGRTGPRTSVVQASPVFGGAA